MTQIDDPALPCPAMRRLALAGAALALLFALGSPVDVAARGSHKLRSFQARSAAESAAYSFEQRRKFDSYKIGRCKRQARRRMLCAAVATGETDRLTATCRIRIQVRAVYPGYWTERANVVWRRCRKEANPYLTYPDARAAIQAEADAFAGTSTAITSMSRRDNVSFSGTSEWTRATDPPSELFPTETCQIELVATLADSAISVANDGFYCY